MAEPFKYLSPREVQQLAAADRDRYLTALHAHLHVTPREKRIEAAPQRKDKAQEPS